MNTWTDKAEANMLHLSRANTLAEAMREWSTTGAYEDTHDIKGVCELCEHEHLRYQYEIENSTTNKSLWVGSTCITKFVPLYENGREVVGEEEKASLLRRRQSEYEAKSREDRAYAVLQQLATVAPDKFEQTSWRRNLELGYSARQMLLLSVTCKNHKIPFNAGDFRINTRKKGIVQQVKEWAPWQYRRLRAALPKSRHAEFDSFFKLRRE